MTSVHRPLRILVGALFMVTLLVAGSVRGAPAQGIIYVKHDAVGNDDGSSWNDAYTDLQDALGTAQSGDEIWVAQDVYYPAPTAIDRTATFELVDGVGLYGGFAGTEAERDQRDWEANITVLSGDLDRNDTTDQNGVVTDTVGILGRNAYHVVTADGVGDTTVLDGFTVTAGLADGDDEQANGGGMHVQSGDVSLVNITLSGNQASSRGGGMYSFDSNPTLTNGTFSGNEAYEGGGMHNREESSPTLTNVIFTGNRATSGGGIHNYSYADLTLTNGSFTGNQAAEYGGGMYNYVFSSSTLTNVTFTGNEAMWGGGMRNNWYSTASLADVTFAGNEAVATGGGMDETGHSNSTLTDVTFISNQAGISGGGMSNSNNNPILINVTFSGNQAATWGGGFNNHDPDSHPTLTTVTFTENYATYGGGMRGNGTLTDVIFTGNQAESGGGMSGSGTLTNVIFTGNQADRGGGMRNTGHSTLNSSTFGGNDAQRGGGMYNEAGEINLVNLTFGGNSAESMGGAVYNENSSPILANCILWGNAAPTGPQIHNEGTSAPYVVYSNIQGDYDGEGNIDTDPVFVDPISANQAPTTAGDYRLTEGSPAIDAGTNDVVTVDIDLEGNPRIVDGTGDGNAIVDMGAYEYLEVLLTIVKEGKGLVTGASGLIDCGSVCTAGFLAHTQFTLTATAELGWTFAAWSEQTYTNENPLPVIIDGDTTITATFALRVPSGPIRVKHDAAGNNDGSSWTDAYTDLQDALGVAQASDEIWVAQGVYYPAPNAIDRAATFELQDDVELYGGFAGTETERDQRDWEGNVTVLSGDLDRNDITDENGVVTDADGIVGDNAFHVVSGIEVGATTVLDGFVVTAGLADGDGSQGMGGGMHNYAESGESNPVLTNVTFAGNQARYGGGMLTNGHSFSGESSPVLTNVTFIGNYAIEHGGGMYNRAQGGTTRPVLTNVIFSGNWAERGGGMYNYGYFGESSPLLTNVTFSGNEADYGGGMVSFGTGYMIGIRGESSPILTNVTFSGNRAAERGGGIHTYVMDGASHATLVNCILWGNSAPIGAQMQIGNDAHPTITYSLVAGGYHGEGNIDTDPVFVDPISANQAPTTAGDYRLTEGSPAIDAGTNDVVTVDIDLEGNPRIVDGTGDGNAIVDMGAYESQIAFLTIIKQGEGLVTSAPAGIDCGTVCTAGYLPGTLVTLTATADTGWTFDHWSGECTGTGTCQVTMDDDKSVTAHFTQEEYTLDVNIVGEGIVGIEPEQAVYHYGDVVTLTATPDLGWTFDGWTGDQLSNDNPLELTIEGDTVITATFTQDEYSLDLTIVGQGDVGVEPDQSTYDYGDVVTLTATAEPGWTFADWSGDMDSTENPLALTIQGDTVITATFTQDGYALDVDVIGEGNVDVEPEQSTYVYSDVVTLTATASSGWTFDGWTGDRVSIDNPLELTIQDDTTITATFTQDEYTLDVTIVGEGEVDIDPEQDTYHHGDVVTLTATAHPGWSFAAWSGDVESTDNPLDFVVEGDTVITATFTEEYKKVYLPLVLANH